MTCWRSHRTLKSRCGHCRKIQTLGSSDFFLVIYFLIRMNIIFIFYLRVFLRLYLTVFDYLTADMEFVKILFSLVKFWAQQCIFISCCNFEQFLVNILGQIYIGFRATWEYKPVICLQCIDFFSRKRVVISKKNVWVRFEIHSRFHFLSSVCDRIY